MCLIGLAWFKSRVCSRPWSRGAGVGCFGTSWEPHISSFGVPCVGAQWPPAACLFGGACFARRDAGPLKEGAYIWFACLKSARWWRCALPNAVGWMAEGLGRYTWPHVLLACSPCVGANREGSGWLFESTEQMEGSPRSNCLLLLLQT